LVYLSILNLYCTIKFSALSTLHFFDVKNLIVKLIDIVTLQVGFNDRWNVMPLTST
jgi:hypothetical protein